MIVLDFLNTVEYPEEMFTENSVCSWLYTDANEKFSELDDVFSFYLAKDSSRFNFFGWTI